MSSNQAEDEQSLPKQLDRPLLGPPLLFFESTEKRGKHELNAMARDPRHDDFCSIRSGFSNVRICVAKQGKHKRDDSTGLAMLHLTATAHTR